MKKRNPKYRKTEIFGRPEVAPQPESFSVERAVATWSTVSPPGTALLTQNVLIRWSQEISRVYEIGSRRTFLVAGRPRMNWAATRITGPRSVSVRFYQTYSPPSHDPPVLQCRRIGDGEGDGAAPSGFAMTGFEIAGVGLQVTDGSMTIQDQVIGVFEGLDSIPSR